MSGCSISFTLVSGINFSSVLEAIASNAHFFSELNVFAKSVLKKNHTYCNRTSENSVSVAAQR